MSDFADQEYLNDPSTGTVGDCWRACIASVIGCPIAEVPHFVRDHGDDGWFEATNAWLAARCGETIRYAPVETWPPDLSTRRPYVILNGGSPRGEFAHCVVADAASGDMVHDPHPSRDGITSVTGAFALVPVEAVSMSAREKVAVALAEWYGHPRATAEFGRAADVAIAAYLDALKVDGCDVVERAKAVLEGTTEGAWSVVYETPDEIGGGEPYPYAIHGPADHSTLDCDWLSDEYKQQYGHEITEIVGLSDADAEFIAAARTLVPELVTEIQRLQVILFLIQEARVDYVGATVCRREHGAVAADRFIRTVFRALDAES